jgi:radical SAM superfamily enzyme YgiQ (UPF0313 family)
VKDDPRKIRRQLLERETRRLAPAHEGRLRVAVAYPNEYRVGMANLGFQAVLEILLGRPGVLVDRFFLPEEKTLSELRRGGAALRGLETGLPLPEFDLILFSISFEPDYVNLVTMLELGGVEPVAEDREGPLVGAGGVAVTFNPEPVAPLCDLVGVGEAEALLPPLLDRLLEGGSREDLLRSARDVAGWYLPADGPHGVSRQAPAELSQPRYPAVISPDSAFASHVDVEISRGCRWRCRFCASGYVVTPYREIGPDRLEEPLLWAVQRRGRVGLVGTDVSDHSQLSPIARKVWELGGEVALPSLRVESVARRSGAAAGLLREQPPQTLTMAVEASCESLRHGLGKRLSDEQVLRAAAIAAEVGVQRLRVYMLVGIPGESWEEVEGIAPLAAELSRVGPAGRPVLSVNGLVPKAGTPFQWEAAPSRAYLRRARDTLRRGLPRDRVELQIESPDWTRWQSLLSLGGREVAPYLRLAAREGWRRALASAGRESPLLAGQGRQPGDPLPWGHVERAVDEAALVGELSRCRRREYTPPNTLCG